MSTKRTCAPSKTFSTCSIKKKRSRFSSASKTNLCGSRTSSKLHLQTSNGSAGRARRSTGRSRFWSSRQVRRRRHGLWSTCFRSGTPASPCWLAHVGAAIDRQSLPGDETRFIGSEINGGAGHFIDHAEAIERRNRIETVAQLLRP